MKKTNPVTAQPQIGSSRMRPSTRWVRRTIIPSIDSFEVLPLEPSREVEPETRPDRARDDADEQTCPRTGEPPDPVAQQDREEVEESVHVIWPSTSSRSCWA